MIWRKWTVRGLVFLITGTLIAVLLLYLTWTNPVAVREQVLARLRVHLPGAIVNLESARMQLFGGISFNELRLTSRKGEENGEFIYVPRGTIALDKEMLSKRKVVIRQMDMPKTKFHIIRGPDGAWNVSKDILAIPDPSQLVPTMVFQQSTLVFEDHFNPPSIPPLEIRNLNLTIINDPLRTLVFKGTGTSDLGGIVQIRGTFERASHEFALFLEALDLPVDGHLADRISRGAPELASHIQHLTGIAGIQAEFRYRPGGTEPWTQDVHLQLSRGALSHPRLPVPLEDLAASCRWTNGRLIVEHLSAKSGGTRLQATGRLLSLHPEADLDGSLKIEHLTVCSDLFKPLPDRLQAIQQDYNPEGFVDLAVDFQRRDGHWRGDSMIYPRDVSMLCAKFPYRLERVGGVIEHHLDQLQPERGALHLNLIGYTGAGGYTGRQEVHIEGKVEGAPPAGVDVKIWGKDIPIDEKLCAALVKPELQKIVRTFSPAGCVDIEAYLHRPQGEAAFANRYFLQFHDVLLSYEAFPYPVENVSGILDVRPDSWEIRDFHGSHNGAKFHCQGRAVCHPNGNDLFVTVTGSDLRVDRELEAALANDTLKRTWKGLAPAGQLDFEAQIHRRPDYPQPDIAVTLLPRGCSILPAFFPYPLTDLTGTVHYHRQEILLSQMRTRHGTTLVSLDKAKVYLKPGGGMSVDVADLAGNPYIQDPELIHALPPALERSLEAVQTQQPVSVRARITVDVPDDTSQAPYVYWDGEIGLKDAFLSAGAQIQHVTGRLDCRGSYQRRLQSLAGNIHLEQATLFGQPVQNIHSQIIVNQQQPDRIDLPNLSARLFGGDVGGWMEVRCGNGIEYDVNLIASQIKLEEFGRHNQLGPKARLSGLAEGRIFLHGKGTDSSGLAGDGTIDVPNGKMYNLPLLLDLIKVLSLHLPDETAFEDAHVKYHIQGNRVEFKQLDLNGNAVSLYGKGTMNLDGSDLNLDFFAVWGRVRELLPAIIEQVPAWVGQSLLKIKMRGRAGGKVECTKEPVPLLVEPMKDLLKTLRGRASRDGKSSPPA